MVRVFFRLFWIGFIAFILKHKEDKPENIQLEGKEGRKLEAPGEREH